MGATPLGFLMHRNKRVAVAMDYSPINTYHYLHTSPSILLSIIPTSGNPFSAIGGHGAITKYDHRAHQHSRIEFRDPYPSTREIVEWMSRNGAEHNDLGPCYHSDALFGFAIR